MVAERFKLCRDLWAAGVKAETLYNDNPKPAKQLDYCFDSGIPLVCFIAEDEINKGVVSVKVLNTKDPQITVPREEFVQRVKELVVANPVLLTISKVIGSGKRRIKEIVIIKVLSYNKLFKFNFIYHLSFSKYHVVCTFLPCVQVLIAIMTWTGRLNLLGLFPEPLGLSHELLTLIVQD